MYEYGIVLEKDSIVCADIGNGSAGRMRQEEAVQLELMDVGENKASYEQILGRTLEELRTDWILYVESIEQEYAWEEADAIEEEYF